MEKRRPLYETKSHLHEQETIRRYIEDKSGRRLLGPLKPSFRCDYLGTKQTLDGRTIITSYIEIKCRTHEKERYPTLILSYDKLRFLHLLSRHFQSDDMDGYGMVHPLVPRVLLCVRFANSSIQLADLSESKCKNYPLRWGGRHDREDSRDMEKVIHIPIEDFKPI